MNALSWMIYLAEVSDSVRWFVWFGTIVSALASAVFVVTSFAMITSAGEPQVKSEDVEGYVYWSKKWIGLLKTSIPLLVVCFLVASLLPAKQTIMLIAASQVGETFLSSDAAKNLGGVGLETVTTLNDYLKSLVPKPVPTEAAERSK